MRNGEVIQIDFTIQFLLGLTFHIFWSVENLLHGPLEVCWCVGQSEGHAVPFEFPPVADKCCEAGSGCFEGNVVVASLQVNQGGVFPSSHPLQNSSCVATGLLKLGCSLIHRDQILANPIILTSLPFGNQHQRSHHWSGLLRMDF